MKEEIVNDYLTPGIGGVGWLGGKSYLWPALGFLTWHWGWAMSRDSSLLMFLFAIFLEQNGACSVHEGSHWCCSAPCKHSACHLSRACLCLTTCAPPRVAFHGPCLLSSVFQEKESHLCWPKFSSAISLLFKKAKQKAMLWLQMALGSFQENVSIWGLFPTSVCPALP